ncbi:MAG: sulfatase-like hydrolase/transferase, partial [Lentisphaeraceae bacterium]|nr:sulfatase-like hydrolase/transferase [Lentisphaeraceae bacterium]
MLTKIAICLSLILSLSCLAQVKKPNIILIIADDQGSADLSCAGINKDVKTPALDRLAKSGTRFTSAYATAPICNASRAALISGVHQARMGIYWYKNPGLSSGKYKTIPEYLKEQGYVTAYVGKAHYGSSSPQSRDFPLNHGFDSFFGFMGGRKHYLFHDDDIENEFLEVQQAAQRSSANPVKGAGSMQKFETLKKGALWSNKEKVNVEGFSTEIFGAKGREFIKENKDKPFFLQVSFNAVHNFTHQLPQEYLQKHNLKSVGDWHPAKEEYLDWYKKGRYPNNPYGRELYLGQLHYLDKEVGKILDLLEEENLTANTLIIYISDNGGATPIYASNGSLRGSKYTLYEGGIRIPMLISWPKHFEAGQVEKRSVSTLDILQTICAA